MSNVFYRFRSIKSLLNFEELEKQTIYFASPEDLNDPMEGYKDIVWNGDEILWKNFFRHYLLCLERVTNLLIIGGEEHYTITEKDIPIFQNSDNFPTEQYKELFEKISSEFIGCILPLIKKIAKRTTAIRKDELDFYLNSVHFIALEIIEKNYIEKKFLSANEFSISNKKESLKYVLEIIDNLEKMIKSNEHKLLEEKIFLIKKSISNDIKLKHNLEYKSIIDKPNRNFVFLDFIEKYLSGIERLIYPKWYTSCFMTECNNSSVWGHYGDNHKGVCLIFESDENNTINLNGITGWGMEGPLRGYLKYKFEKVNYQNKFPEIDFFKSLGRLTIHSLEKDWYSDENGKVSDISESVLDSQDRWRKEYWTNYNKPLLRKTKDWEYEKEYRLILSSTFTDYEMKEDRLLNYKFNSLKGLIFGIKTSTEDKLKIIDILNKKLKEEKRNDFELYQAYFSNEKQNIQHSKISFW